MSFPPVYSFVPPPFINPPPSTQIQLVSNSTSTPTITTTTSIASVTNNTTTEVTTVNNAFDRPITTVFVGDISDKIPDTLMREILQKCGNVLSWKRVQVASSFKAFGFCEYDNPEATLRCIRLLNEFNINDKALKVKVDPKTDELLSEYKEKKRKAIEVRESDDLSLTDEMKLEKINAIYAKEIEEDKNVLKQIKKLISDTGLKSSEGEKSNMKPDISKKLDIEELELGSDTKELINKEIEIFRHRYKDDESKEDEERFKRIREREKERGKDVKEKQKKRRSKSRNDEGRKRIKTESKDSTPVKKRKSGSRETHKSSKRKKSDVKELDEYEFAIIKKYEKKLRDKEAAYQKRLQIWEARERKKYNEYELEAVKKVQKEREISDEARKLQIFFEDYDDDKCDPKYYKGAELDRRLNSRRSEEISDARDREKEKDQIEGTKERLIKEHNPNVEEIISKMEQSMQEHLKRRLPTNVPLFLMDTQDENILPNVEEIDNNETIDNEIVNDETIDNDTVQEIESSPNQDETNQNLDQPSETELNADIVQENKQENTQMGMEKENDNLQNEITNPTPECNPSSHEECKNTVLNGDNDDVAPESGVSESSRKIMVKQIIDSIPTVKADLFAYPVDWTGVDKEFVECRIKPWVKKKIVAYIGEDEPSLSQFICDQVLEHKTPDQILGDIAMVLEEEADVFVMKMWRLLIYVIEEKKAGLDKQ